VEFGFTEEQQHLRRSVREFAEGEIAPHVMEWTKRRIFRWRSCPSWRRWGCSALFFRNSMAARAGLYRIRAGD